MLRLRSSTCSRITRCLKSAHSRWNSSSSSSSPPCEEETLVAAVVLERLPLIVPLPKPEVANFRNFSFAWHNQYRRHYPEEFLDALSVNSARETTMELIFEPAPRVTEADEKNDRRSLERALERRLYLIIKGHPFGSLKDQAIWHFPERVYGNEETLRLCAEAILIPDVAKKDDVYYVGNAPCGHMCVKLPGNGSPMPTQLKRFFFRSQLVGKLRLAGLNHEDYAWVTKEELLEYFEPEPSAYLKQMLVDDMTVIY